jgi:MFS family permease
MVVGSILLIIGLALMGTIDYDTNFVVLSIYMFVLGSGVGMVMQNLVLIVQNVVSPSEMGAASASVTFFRSLGGTAGVSVLGSVLGTQVANHIADKSHELAEAITKLGPAGATIGKALQSGTIPNVSSLPESVRVIVESSYGQSVAFVFLVAVPLAVITLIAVCLLPNKKLGTKTTIERQYEEDAAASATGHAHSTGLIAAAAAELIDDADALIAGEPLEAAEAQARAGDGGEPQDGRVASIRSIEHR